MRYEFSKDGLEKDRRESGTCALCLACLPHLIIRLRKSRG